MQSEPTRWKRLLLALIAPLAAAACATAERPERDADQLRADKAALLQRQDDRYVVARDKIVRRLELIAAGEAEDDAFDVLLLSGGGDWGIFGTALLNGWREEGRLPFPEFDYVSGISTGSLIAAYTFPGTPERYARMERYYLEADPDFIALPDGLSLLGRAVRNEPALTDTTKVEAAIEQAIDDELIAQILEGNAESRLLGVGAVNVDMGVFDPFDVGEELLAADDKADRLRRILLASSSVPAAFPPVEIDGDLYVDGGASVGIPIFRISMVADSVARYIEANGRPPPKIRVWVLYNNKIGVIPAVTEATWSDVALRSYKVALQTGLVTPLYALNRVIQLVEEHGDAEIELRWTAIPEDWVEIAPKGVFDPEEMQVLRDMGRRMGIEGDWRTDVPDF